MPDRDAQRQTLLQQALRNAPFEGWTDSAYCRAVADARFTTPQAQLLFPHGMRDVLDFIAKTMDAQMIEASKTLQLPTLKIHQRIIALVRLRLELNNPYREAIRRAQAHYALPMNIADGLKILWRTADEIWHLAGDTATDFNWYSKRFLLANVYASTALVWLDDESENHADSWAFLERRVQDVLKITKARMKIEEKWKQWTGGVAAA